MNRLRLSSREATAAGLGCTEQVRSGRALERLALGPDEAVLGCVLGRSAEVGQRGSGVYMQVVMQIRRRRVPSGHRPAREGVPARCGGESADWRVDNVMYRAPTACCPPCDWPDVLVYGSVCAAWSAVLKFCRAYSDQYNGQYRGQMQQLGGPPRRLCGWCT